GAGGTHVAASTADSASSTSAQSSTTSAQSSTSSAQSSTSSAQSSTSSGGPCESGFADCDHEPANGGGTNTQTSVAGCGSCGHACSSKNGAPSCDQGKCAIACADVFGDCDGNPANGCEAELATDAKHCGDCSTACSTLNGTASCVGGGCKIACGNGFGDC